MSQKTLKSQVVDKYWVVTNLKTKERVKTKQIGRLLKKVNISKNRIKEMIHLEERICKNYKIKKFDQTNNLSHTIEESLKKINCTKSAIKSRLLKLRKQTP
jgi:hypothetical protein